MAKAEKKKAKPKAKLTDKEQSERFKETARKLGLNESGDDFQKAAAAILKPKVGRSRPSD